MEQLNLITGFCDTPAGRLALSEANGALIGVSWVDPKAAISETAAGVTPLLERAAEQLDEYFAGTRRIFDLPLDPHGTSYQQDVWREMTRIPWGATLSYGALARKLGSVARAVGRACGANPIPIIIPCHRVLGADGALGGFSGGEGRPTKRFLLAVEGVSATTPDLFTAAGLSLSSGP